MGDGADAVSDFRAIEANDGDRAAPFVGDLAEIGHLKSLVSQPPSMSASSPRDKLNAGGRRRWHVESYCGSFGHSIGKRAFPLYWATFFHVNGDYCQSIPPVGV